MKKLLLFFAIIGLSVSGVQAQVNINIEQVPSNENSALNSATESFNNGTLFTSEDLLGVFANGEFISGIQRLIIDANQVAKIKTVGSGNSATLTQSGTSNIGIINIDGNGNSASLNQAGSGLLSAIKIEGSFNSLDVEQQGNALQNLILLGGNNLNFDVQQDASGVKLTQTGSGIPLQIKSTGRTIPLIIRSH